MVWEVAYDAKLRPQGREIEFERICLVHDHGGRIERMAQLRGEVPIDLDDVQWLHERRKRPCQRREPRSDFDDAFTPRG